MQVSLSPRFRRRFRKLPLALREEAYEKLLQFEYPENHASLRVHKLKGKFDGAWSFSVNYRYRIVFEWEKKGESAVALTIGDHTVYD